MNTDAQNNREGGGAENVALKRRVAPGKESAHGKLHRAAWRHESLIEMIRKAAHLPITAS